MRMMFERMRAMARHAYMILAHANFSQLRLLLLLLDHPDNDIYVHVDTESRCGSLDGLAACCRRSRVLVSQKIRVKWGEYSIVQAELLLLSQAAQERHDYYHLLSGMDMPLKTQDEIHQFFDEHAGIEFVAGTEYSEPGVTLARLKKRLYNSPLRGGAIYKGSQWFSITHAFARHLLGMENMIRRLFEGTHTPDEKFVQTMLLNSRSSYRWSGAIDEDFPSLNMREIEWNYSGCRACAHPKTFTIADERRLLASRCLFARKFDQRRDSRIIAALARHIAGASASPLNAGDEQPSPGQNGPSGIEVEPVILSVQNSARQRCPCYPVRQSLSKRNIERVERHVRVWRTYSPGRRRSPFATDNPARQSDPIEQPGASEVSIQDESPPTVEFFVQPDQPGDTINKASGGSTRRKRRQLVPRPLKHREPPTRRFPLKARQPSPPAARRGRGR
jgi:hypothetical protein